MDANDLATEEKQILLRIARRALEQSVRGEKVSPLELKSLPPRLQGWGASFVTLTMHGDLRGCIGALEPYQPLAEDVREHVIAAAQEDYRFTPVRSDELSDITIEVSRLTTPVPLEYSTPEDLLSKLRPGVDGVVLRDGFQRATFLPQVWEKMSGAEEFLSHLCLKMGATADVWRHKHLDVLVYQVEEFHE